MKNALRHDFYKLFHSPFILVCFIVSALFALFGPISSILGFDDTLSFYIESHTGMLPVLVVIFAVGFCTRDFSSGYVKNIYVSSKKTCYVLSKIVVIAVYTLAMYLWIFLITVIFTAFAHPRAFDMPFFRYDSFNSPGVHLEDWVWGQLLLIGLSFAAGVLVNAFACVCKIGFVVAIVSIAYCFLYGWIYAGINAIIGHGFNIAKYTIMENAASMRAWVPDVQKLICLGVIFGFSLLGFLIAWLAYSRKNY